MDINHQHIRCRIIGSWVDQSLINYKLECGFHFTISKDDERAQLLFSQPIDNQTFCIQKVYDHPYYLITDNTAGNKHYCFILSENKIIDHGSKTIVLWEENHVFGIAEKIRGKNNELIGNIAIEVTLDNGFAFHLPWNSGAGIGYNIDVGDAILIHFPLVNSQTKFTVPLLSYWKNGRHQHDVRIEPDLFGTVPLKHSQ